MSVDLASLREDYRFRGFDRPDLAADPFEQFERWFAEWSATDPYDPSAMVLATVDADGRPAARFVLLKGVDDRGFVFFTNYDSDKGRALAARPEAELCFGWIPLSRQVRVHGAVERVSDDESEAYFASRPRGSQIGAHASPQSQVVASREVLEARVAQLEETYRDQPVPRPASWGGYRLLPETFEFWQGRSARLHDRFRYRRVAAAEGADPEGGASWSLERIAP